MTATATDKCGYGTEDSEDEDYVGEEEASAFCAGDDDTIGGFQSTAGGKKGVSFDASVAFSPTKSGKKIRSGTGDWSRKIVLPYFVDRWTDEKLNERSSLQVHLLSGDMPHEKICCRVASAKMNLSSGLISMTS